MPAGGHDDPEAEPLGPETKSCLRHAHDTVVTLRREVEHLRPKAEAWDVLRTVVPALTQREGGYAEADVTWRIKTLLERAEALKANPIPAT